MLLEKLGGFFVIVIAVAVLAGISVFDPPVFVQITIALIGSFFCLIGIVILFSEAQIWTKKARVR